MTNVEHWLSVTGYEGLYEVSDLGNVRSLPRRTRVGMRGGHTVTPYADDHGYLRVSLWRNGKRSRRCVHRIVLRAFAGPPPAGQECLHGPGGRLDNRLVNLSYGPHAQNVGADKIRDGTDNRGERSAHAKFTWDEVTEIRRLAATGIMQKSLASIYGVGTSTMSRIIRGQRWRQP